MLVLAGTAIVACGLASIFLDPPGSEPEVPTVAPQHETAVTNISNINITEHNVQITTINDHKLIVTAKDGGVFEIEVFGGDRVSSTQTSSRTVRILVEDEED